MRSAKAVHPHHVSSPLLQLFTGVDDVPVVPHDVFTHGCNGDHGWKTGFLYDVEGTEGFFCKIESLADQKINPLINRPANHFFKHLPDLGLAVLVFRVPDVRIGNVSGKQIGFLAFRHAGRDLPGNLKGVAVQGFEQVFFVNDAHLLPVGVIGKSLDHIGSGMLKILMQDSQSLRVVQGHLGNKFTGGQITAAFHFKQISLGTNNTIGVQSFQ